LVTKFPAQHHPLSALAVPAQEWAVGKRDRRKVKISEAIVNEGATYPFESSQDMWMNAHY
jgi:hypothetical protein